MTAMTMDLFKERMAGIDSRIREMEALPTDLPPTQWEMAIDRGIALAVASMQAYAELHGKSVDENEDPLSVFRGFVKGDPSLNAVRDNLRTLIFYRNCVQTAALDQLPSNVVRMTARTIRHMYFYLWSRAEQEISS